jgi:hypothetical protein
MANLQNSLDEDKSDLEEQVKVLQNRLDQARQQNNEFQVKSNSS